VRFLEDFFNIKLSVDKSSLYVDEYQDGDILILTRMLTNLHDEDDTYNSSVIKDPLFSEPLMSLENRSYHGLESLDAFDFVTPSDESAKPEGEAEMEF